MKIVEFFHNNKSVTVTFEITNKNHTIFVSADNTKNKHGFDIKNLDFFIPYATVLALTAGEDIDLNNYDISTDTANSFIIARDFYLKIFSSLFSRKISLINFNIPVEQNQTPNGKSSCGLFFSLGVDSFDSLLELSRQQTQKLTLINILGLDVHRKDANIYEKIQSQIINVADCFNSDVLFITTNMREIMEEYILWTYGHGAVLCSMALLIAESFDKVFIPSTLRVNQQVAHGSHLNLDEVWSSKFLAIIHHGAERTRLQKVLKNISNSEVAIKNLNVCYKNIGNHLNCGMCNKCLITKLEFYVADKLENSNFIDKTLSKNHIKSIIVSDKIAQAFISELIPCIKNSEYREILEKKVLECDAKNHTHRQVGAFKKNKNLLFVDFNGVISFKNFWFSIHDKNHKLNKYLDKIEVFLFKENRDLVIKWMLGQCTSEDVHSIICKNIGVDYNELFTVFTNDCKNLDISIKILDKIEKLKPYYTCILATDNMDSLDRYTVPNNPKINDVFDALHNSYYEKKMKAGNNGEFFMDLINKYNAEVGNCILIDDSAGNCKCFVSLGGQAYQTKTEIETLAVLDKIYENVISKWEWQY